MDVMIKKRKKKKSLKQMIEIFNSQWWRKLFSPKNTYRSKPYHEISKCRY